MWHWENRFVRKSAAKELICPSSGKLRSSVSFCTPKLCGMQVAPAKAKCDRWMDRQTDYVKSNPYASLCFAVTSKTSVPQNTCGTSKSKECEPTDRWMEKQTIKQSLCGTLFPWYIKTWLMPNTYHNTWPEHLDRSVCLASRLADSFWGMMPR